MKPAWDKLGSEYADSPSVMIADVDCTSTGKELCSKYDVTGYPTIKYFADGDVEGTDYQGGRDFDSLKSFTENTLEVKCDPNDPSECTDREKAYIEKMKAKSASDRQSQLARLQKMAGASMTADLKKWMSQRISILSGLTSNEEL